MLSYCSEDAQIGKNPSDAGIAKWKEELNILQESTKNEQSGIRLVSYHEEGVIKNLKDVLMVVDNLFADDADFVFYLDNRYLEYRITSIGERRNRLKTFSQRGIMGPNYETRFEKLKERLRKEIQVGMKLVSLTWYLNGETYHSLAIASDTEGIIYDNIGHLIIKPLTDDVSDIQKDEWSSSMVAPATKTGEELPSPLIARFVTSGSNTDVYGHLAYEYTLQCKSSFDSSGLFVGKQFAVHSYSAPGWECQSAIRTISGEPYESYRHEFAWAFAFGDTNVWIMWDGGAYVLSGQHVASSTGIHTIESVEQ